MKWRFLGLPSTPGREDDRGRQEERKAHGVLVVEPAEEPGHHGYALPAYPGLQSEHLGAHAGEVSWLHEDVLTWTPPRTYDPWHDRAVFHFLVDLADQQKYVEILLSALAPDGTAIFGTFAPDGPPQCSGLPVAHYDAATLGAMLGSSFVLLDERREEHHTPTGAMQPFTWTTFRRQ